MELEKTAASLKRNRYQVSIFQTGREACQYLDNVLDQLTIGFGDSETMSQMALYQSLSAHNTVIDPKQSTDNASFLQTARQALTAEVFLTSVNAITEDGVLVNLDGTGNRIAGSLFGHKKVYYLAGINKIVPDLEAAIRRVRQIAAPKNARRLNLKTPCAVLGNGCHDCSSPDRICNGLLIQYKKMNDMDAEVILINEALGF